MEGGEGGNGRALGYLRIFVKTRTWWGKRGIRGEKERRRRIRRGRIRKRKNKGIEKVARVRKAEEESFTYK